MIKTNEFEFDRKGCITFYATVNYLKVLKVCVLHARRKKIKKPFQWRMVPTLTESV